MKRASWALKTTFHHLRQQQRLGEDKARRLQTYRHQFQHFVNVMHGYMSNQIFYISWKEFQVELATKVGGWQRGRERRTKKLGVGDSWKEDTSES